MNKEIWELFEDLRFYIGAFFLIVGAVLTVEGLAHPEPNEQLNLITGVCFMVFSLAALSLSLYSHWRRCAVSAAKAARVTKTETSRSIPELPQTLQA